VREMEDEYTAAFGRKDANALAALLAEDVTLVTEWGDVVQGRAEIERMLADVFPGMPDKLEIESTPAHARAIADDVIVSHGVLHKVGAGKTGSPTRGSWCGRAGSGGSRRSTLRQRARCRTLGRVEPTPP